MNTIEPLPWQREAWTQLMRARANGQFAHAWLVSGPYGIGKRAFVAALAAALLCEQPRADGIACGACNSCRMLASGGHPDAHLLGLDGHLGLAADPSLRRKDGITHWEPDKGSKRREIAIGGVRSLIEGLQVVSHRRGVKFAAISPAEELNRSSADALLKTIEEPTAETHLFLIADQSLNLSPTLRSRCQKLRFGFPPESGALAWLRERKPDAAAEACMAALTQARRAPLPALELLEQDGASPALAWRKSLDEIAAGRGDPMKLAASVESEEATAFLHCCQAWLADQLRTQALEGFRLSGRRVAELNEELHEAHRRLGANGAVQLVLDALLIGWTRLLAPPPAGSPQSPSMSNKARA